MIERISHYRVVQLIGRGAMGEVYRAIDERLGRAVAVKLLPASSSESADSQARLLREARAASALNHPGIVTVHDIGAWDGRVFMVMELVEGGRFSDSARAGIALADALELVAEAADALGAAHARFIFHRDIKSDNLMRTRTGRAKVLDFGLAKLRDTVASEAAAVSSGELPRLDTQDAYAATVAPDTAATLPGARLPGAVVEQLGSKEASPFIGSSSPSDTIAGSIFGTPAYMSPEQATGRPIDATSEVFSLGVVLYELVTGRLPFSGDSIQATIDAISHAPIEPPSRRAPSRRIPPFIDALVLRAIERDRTRRFSDMATFASAMRRERQRLVGRRSRLGLVAGGAVAALALGGVQLARHRPAVVAPKLTTVKRITFDSGCEERPSFWADGKKIVYDGLIDGDYEVFSLDLASGTRTRLTTSEGWDYSASLSPDGKRLAWLHKGSDGPELLVADANQGAPRVLGLMDAGPSWTADGALLVTFDTRHIEKLSLPDGKRSVIGTVDHAVDFIQLVASRSGVVVATWADPATGRTIGATDGAGQVRTLVPDLTGGGIAMAPSQRAFYYARKGGDAFELIRRSLDDGSEVAVPGGSTPVTFALAPDGKRLVYSTCAASRRIVHIEPDRRTADVLGAGATNDVTPRIVDRNRLVFGSDRAGTKQIWLYDGRTGDYRALTPEGVEPAVSHDGRWVAYADHTQKGIFLVPLAGGTPRRVTSDGSDTRPAFSRDDRTLVFERQADQPRIWATSLDGQSPRLLSPDAGMSPTTSPTEDFVVYLAGKGAVTMLNTTTLTGGPGPRKPIDLGAGVFDRPVFSPDGKRVALLRNFEEVVEVPLAPGGSLTRRWGSRSDGLHSVAYDLDGKSFVVSLTHWEGDLWLADGDLP